MKYGREMHKLYRAGEADGRLLVKECRNVPNVRPDFVNYKSRTIYELKPYNPRGIKSGIKQLNRYKLEYEKFYNNNWKTVLEFY